MALWNGTATTSYATKKQLLSSISGIYDDLADFSFSTISTVGTLTATQWISAPVLYVSDIQGATINISGITINSNGILNAPIVSLSSLSFKGIDKLLDLDVSFDLGLGQALGGLLGGLGAAVGGGLIAAGTGVGLAIQGAEQGIATLIAGRPQNYINSNVYETINFTTQLQISTLGNAYPLYSSIFRTVSSISPDTVPGQEVFTSTFFNPGTTCIRSISDPFQLITGNSNLNTSTIQSFGQWIPFDDATPAGEDIIARDAYFSTTQIALTGDPVFGTIQVPLQIYQSNDMIYPNIQSQILTTGFSNNINRPWNYVYPLQDLDFNIMPVFQHMTLWSSILNFVSSPYEQFVSTLTTAPATYFITSTISTPALFIWDGAGVGNFAVCEPDESGFRSTATFDFQANSQDIVIQWGLAVDNRNSTIGAGTAKRVTWDNDANTSNFENIPIPASTVVSAQLNTQFYFEQSPYELRLFTDGSEGQNTGFKINTSTMRVGTGFANYSASNQPGYAFQFDGNTFINGTLEATTIIALSSIVSVSTFSQTLFSTNVIEAASGIFTSTLTEEAYSQTAYISCLKSSDNFTNDYIYALSRMRLAGFDTPLSIVVGTPSNIYDPSARFDFGTNNNVGEFYITARPANNTIAYFSQSNVSISNLDVYNLTASNLIYGQAQAPYLATSTIEFGWTGSFTFGGPVDFALQQYLSTPVGSYWSNYAAASNQILNIMNFNNQVTAIAQQFSTPLIYNNTTFAASNQQGWASTIFYNELGTTARVNLSSNAGPGEVSLQASQNNILVALNTFGASNLGGISIPVAVPSTVRFTTDGSQWVVNPLPPPPGTISYSNAFQMTMDFENLNISTSDTLNISAETINLNGQVVAPNIQLGDVYLDGFLSSVQVRADSINGYVSVSDYTGSLSGAIPATPLNLQYTINSTDFLNVRTAVIPSRGYNLFNSFNVEEWNNTVWNIDTTLTAGRPIIIVGEVLQLVPAFTPYGGQFWINNTIDSPPLVIPVYQNNEGVLTLLGNVAGNTYARVYTANGTTWNIQTSVPNPQGNTSSIYANYYQVQMNSALTTINVGMPMVYNMPSLTYNTNKTLFYSPQIRVATIDAPSFNTREAGFENVLYYDSNISFSRISGTAFWESAAFNPIINTYSNSYFSIAGWECFISLTRVRISGNAISSWDVEATAYPVGGGATDFIWGSARYLKIITDEISPSGNLRENYLMAPKNYFNFIWQGQGPIS